MKNKNKFFKNTKVGWKIHMMISYPLLMTFLTSRIQALQHHVCEPQGVICWKINLIWSHSMRVSWSASELFTQPSCKKKVQEKRERERERDRQIDRQTDRKGRKKWTKSQIKQKKNKTNKMFFYNLCLEISAFSKKINKRFPITWETQNALLKTTFNLFFSMKHCQSLLSLFFLCLFGHLPLKV